MLAPVFHIFVELATPKMQTLVYYAIYHETKAKIIKAIVVSRSEARGSSSNGIETDFGGRSNEQMSMSVYILNDSKMQNDADIPLKPEMD